MYIRAYICIFVYSEKCKYNISNKKPSKACQYMCASVLVCACLAALPAMLWVEEAERRIGGCNRRRLGLGLGLIDLRVRV